MAIEAEEYAARRERLAGLVVQFHLGGEAPEGTVVVREDVIEVTAAGGRML